MSGQEISLFDLHAGEAAKVKGQRRAREHRPAQADALLDTLRDLARIRPSLTSDDLHEALVRKGLRHPDEPNLFGVVFSAATHEGFLTRGSQVTKSRRPQAKGRNLLIWDSLIFTGRAS